MHIAIFIKSLWWIVPVFGMPIIEIILKKFDI